MFSTFTRRVLALLAAAILVACSAALPTNENVGTSAATLSVNAHGINYNGGAVLSGTVNVYLIFYGATTDPTLTSSTQSSMQSFVDNIDWATGDQVWNIVTTYYDTTGARASNNLVFGGATFDSTYSGGNGNNYAADINRAAIVSHAIHYGSPALPYDAHGIYVILGGQDIKPTEFCQDPNFIGHEACGNHERDADPVNGQDLNINFIGQCGGVCGGGEIYSATLHELAETVTDPGTVTTNDAWGNTAQNGLNGEIGDLCAANGMVCNSNGYLVQELWVNKGHAGGQNGYCACNMNLPGDIQGDGYSDIALTGGSTWGSVPVAFADKFGGWIVHNDALPTFPNWAGNTGVHAVAGDYDGDGKTDVALLSLSNYTIPIAFSNYSLSGTQVVGSFAPVTDCPNTCVVNGPHGCLPNFATTACSAPGGPTANFVVWSVASGAKFSAGDVNGDGRSDIILTGGSGWTTLPVALSQGDGSFQIDNYTLPSGFPGNTFNSWANQAGAHVVAGDFNGDSWTDFALIGVTSGGSPLGYIPIALSKGDGTFTIIANPDTNSFQAMALTAGAIPVAGDFDQDGRGDIALVGGVYWNTIPFVSSQGNGSFALVNNTVWYPSDYATFDNWAEQYWPPQTRMYAVGGRYSGFSSTNIALVDGSTRSFNRLGYPIYTPWSTIPVARIGDTSNDTAPYSTWVVTNGGTSSGYSLSTFQGWAGVANVQAVGGL